MQLTFNLAIKSPRPGKTFFKNTTWLDAGWATRCLGFTKKVEISQSMSDALKPLQTQEDDHDQQLYDALWLAQHYYDLNQRQSFSFTFDFLREDKISGRMIETSLRLHLEEKDHVILSPESQRPCFTRLPKTYWC